MRIGEEIPLIGNWSAIHFLENNGAAYGWQIDGDIGKLTLSIARLLAVVLISFLLYRSIQKKKAKKLIYSIALILAGAIGNLIDTCFYGVLFSRSSVFTIADFSSEKENYAGFLQGKVVDMLHFPIVHIHQKSLPAFIPQFLIGPDHHLIFFRPVFNIADAALLTGCVLFVYYQIQRLKKVH